MQGAGGSAGGGRQLHGVGGVFVAPFNNPSPGIGSGGSNNSAGIGGFATTQVIPVVLSQVAVAGAGVLLGAVQPLINKELQVCLRLLLVALEEKQ